MVFRKGYIMPRETVLAEIDSVLAEYKSVEAEYGHREGEDEYEIAAPHPVESRITTLLLSAIHRHAPPRSPYISRAELAERCFIQNDDGLIRELAGILQALRADYEGDRIKTFQELVHSDLFADLLEAADYLLGETYKDPAAVMAGGVLEQHLREVCRKHGIDTTFTTPGGDTKPKMIDTMNADLARASAYGKIEQKQVTAWAGIRNAAAHGEYGKYDDNQVRQMVVGIRDFISKYPA
jgi:hypothetical protein